MGSLTNLILSSGTATRCSPTPRKPPTPITTALMFPLLSVNRSLIEPRLLFLHWSCSWPPFLLHSRNRPARLQRIEMCQSRHSVLGLGNASKAALLGQPRITAPNLFIPVTFVGYPSIPPRVRESKRLDAVKLNVEPIQRPVP